MKIIVASSLSAFEHGGLRGVVEDLTASLRSDDHEVEDIRLPLHRDPELTIEQMLVVRLTDLSHAGDVTVAVGSPAHLLEHPNKVVWLGPQGDHGGDPLAHGNAPDRAALARARRAFSTSVAVSERLRRERGIETEVLYPPLRDPQPYYCGPPQNYILMLSGDRRALADHAMAQVHGGTRLEFADGLSEADTLERLAGALAVMHLPVQEAYGSTTLTGFQAGKPVITCTDSGVAAELVVDEVNGRIVPPTPAAIAGAVQALASDRARAAAMGRRGTARIAELGLRWETVVAELLR